MGALHPVLVLGLDGATLDVVRPLAAAGRLPNLAQWMEQGRPAPLPSTVPAMTFPAWSSFLTGLDPGEHGLFDFTQKIPGRYGIRFTNASDRHGASLYRRVSEAGGAVLALGMPATFPPEPVRGLLVCGFDAPVSAGSDAGSSSDPALYRELAQRVGPWMRPDLDESAEREDEHAHERVVDLLVERVRRKTDFALEALAALRARGEAPALVNLVYSESDTVAHHFWRDHDPHSPRHDPRAGARRRGAIAEVYEALDAACGELREAVGSEASCFVVSDHGSGGASRRVVHLNRHLEACGLLRRLPHAAGGWDRLARSTRDAALRALPPRLAQTLFRRGRSLAARLESTARFGGLDWSQTAAFSEEANTQPGVWLNLRGREQQGCVPPRDRERVLRDLMDALLDWKLPNGDPVVARARPREEVYRGPLVERAPDLVVELGLDGGYGLSLVQTPWGRPAGPLRELESDELAGGRGRGMNGVHRPDGLWIGPREVPVPGSIREVAPCLLGALGLSGEAPSDGVAPGPRPYSDEEALQVAARLRKLGYLE